MQTIDTIKEKISGFSVNSEQLGGLNRTSWMLCAQLVHLASDPSVFDLKKAQGIAEQVLDVECRYVAQNFMQEQIEAQVLPEIGNAMSRMVEDSPLSICQTDEVEITRMLGFLDRFVGQAAMNAEDRIIDLLPVLWMLGLIKQEHPKESCETVQA